MMGARLRLPYHSYRQSLARYADMGGAEVIFGVTELIGSARGQMKGQSLVSISFFRDDKIFYSTRAQERSAEFDNYKSALCGVLCSWESNFEERRTQNRPAERSIIQTLRPILTALFFPFF